MELYNIKYYKKHALCFLRFEFHNYLLFISGILFSAPCCTSKSLCHSQAYFLVAVWLCAYG